MHWRPTIIGLALTLAVLGQTGFLTGCSSTPPRYPESHARFERIATAVQALQQAYKNRGFWAGLEHGYNAHNQYIETTISTGYIGLFLLLFMIFYFGKTALANKDYLTLSCLAFFAISMLTESMFERANAVLLFTSFFPLMLSLSNPHSQNKVVK